MTLILLQAAGSAITNILFLVSFIFITYFFFMRPQMKKQREQADFSNSLEKGNEVVTMSGIIGRIVKVEGEVVTLQVSDKVSMRFVKNAISKEMTQAYAKGDNVVPEQAS